MFTGRQKILSRYRSYHGGTNATLQLTGDPRRWANEPGMPGVVRVMDPWPYKYSFGDDPASITRNNLTYLEEVIDYEGPHTIAAMIVESVTGTNGILIPPPGYMQGLRALLSRHGILLICDEVMAGLGRTGKLFAFEHDGDPARHRDDGEGADLLLRAARRDGGLDADRRVLQAERLLRRPDLQRPSRSASPSPRRCSR